MEVPPIPIGLDAYRQWERWPCLRVGQQTFMRSTYDRSGGNESADASHFLYQLADDRNVTLDIEGAGVLNFVRYNHWHGSPWHYLVDGADHTVTETSTADPDHPREGSAFLPAGLFPEPLAWTWAATRGADLIGVPIPFSRSFRMDYERTHYGTGYYIFSRYVPGASLSHPIRSWDGRTPPAPDVLTLVARAGSDLVHSADSPEGRKLGVRERHGALGLAPGPAALLTRFEGEASVIRALELSAPKDQAIALGRARLRITWDDRAEPSIDAPVALFYGAGTLYNRDGKEYLVKAFPVHVRFDADRVHLACYFPMPFFRSARIELASGESQPVSDVRWSIRTVPFRDRPESVGYFHATYRDHPRPTPGHDLVLLDTWVTEGTGSWSGHLVGTSFIFSHNANLGTLEGDPRFFFDDSLTPQVQGTGTEEWAGGGDYWGGLNMTLPFVGHPVGARSPQTARNDEDKIESGYRFLLADLMPFGRNATVTLEHGGMNESKEHYETVTYWYGAPGSTLVGTDTLWVGNADSEAAHGYLSPDASDPVDVTSRYEWGVDHLNGDEIYAAETARGRTTTGTSEFTLALDPHNLGVSLRRKLDYQYPNQRAEVFVADIPAMASAPYRARKRAPALSRTLLRRRPKCTSPQPLSRALLRRWERGKCTRSRRLSPLLVSLSERPGEGPGVRCSAPKRPAGRGGRGVRCSSSSARVPASRRPPVYRWRRAGIWYLAGSNSCVFSNPREETGAAQHTVQTSNRRFRDDDFLLPMALTRGRSKIRVRIRFTPVARPLYPGYPVPKLAWSEMRYTVNSYVWPPRPVSWKQP